MKEKYASIFNSILFKGLNEEKISEEIRRINYTVREYSKDEIIALEDSPCKSVAIVLEGEIELQKIYASGKIFILRKLQESEVFGEVVVFSDRNTYPATIVSSSKSKIMFLSKEGILKLCRIDEEFLNNFMKLMSSKVLTLNSKLKEMSFKNIREKTANFILEEYKSQNSLKVKLKDSKQNIALNLGILRPSLSRELIKMREEGIINFDSRYIYILDLDRIYKILN
ncbi:MAG: Crp/Fnr family transcriptional regulator [Bacillota bacterium]|nr:Crp/Fnr family transcriptional regulator [Bacillota bacterium]